MKPLVMAVAVAILFAPATSFARHHSSDRVRDSLPRRSAMRNALGFSGNPHYAGIMGLRSHGGHMHDIRTELR